MGKISEEKRADLNLYATKKGANLQASKYCNTNAEVDAVYECTQIIKCNRFLYLRAVYEAPHNVEYNEKQRQDAIGAEGNVRELVVAIQQQYPLASNVRVVKNEIYNLCRKELLETGSIGKKRIAKIIAGLKSTLTDEEEEFASFHKYTPEYIQLLKELGLDWLLDKSL